MTTKESKDPGCQVDTCKEGPFNHTIVDTIWIEIKDILRKGKQNVSDILKVFKKTLTNKKEVPSVPLPKEVTTLNLQVGERVKIKSVGIIIDGNRR